MIKEVLQQLEPLDAQIDALCSSTDDAEMANTTTHAAELAELSAQENMLLQRCTSLTPEDRVFLARRPDRPHIGEIIDNLFTDFFEQCGDRQCKEDAAILCGIARFHGMPVTVLGHRKGTTLEENLRCNFGMPGPEGYRKALRVMKQAEKFRRPIITFIDTPGAAHVGQYHIPGMHGGLQSRGIQRSHHGKHLFLWHRLRGFDRAARVQPTRNAHGAGNDAGGVGQFLFAVCSAVGAGIAGHGIVICGVHPQMAPLGAADADQLFYCFCHDCGTSSTATISGPSAFCSRALGSVMC